MSSTSNEIRRLIQAFLDARSEVIPPSRRPRKQAPGEEDSQDYFGQVEDIDPFVVEQALEAVVPPEQKENQEKDKEVAKVCLTCAECTLDAESWDHPDHEQLHLHGDISTRVQAFQ